MNTEALKDRELTNAELEAITGGDGSSDWHEVKICVTAWTRPSVPQAVIDSASKPIATCPK
jgi:hypothetical protein